MKISGIKLESHKYLVFHLTHCIKQTRLNIFAEVFSNTSHHTQLDDSVRWEAMSYKLGASVPLSTSQIKSKPMLTQCWHSIMPKATVARWARLTIKCLWSFYFSSPTTFWSRLNLDFIIDTACLLAKELQNGTKVEEVYPVEYLPTFLL